MIVRKYCLYQVIGLAITLVMINSSIVSAQGSIFGSVTNSNFTIPADGQISFFGYLDNTDEEIRIDSCVGAGYDGGNWYDDFQNYLTEAPGNPYSFHFFNPVNGEGSILSKSIPDNSFQQEDITLGSVPWPSAVNGLIGQFNSPAEIEIGWDDDPGRTYHIYRREAYSNGSFFRIDDPSGLLSNPGISDSFFVDQNVDSLGEYDYLVISEDAFGNLSAHSEIITVGMASSYLSGDANGDNFVDVGDIVYIISYVFREGALPDPYLSGDANCDSTVDHGDAVYLIYYVFKEGPPADCQ
jgi:hypothetical protein